MHMHLHMLCNARHQAMHCKPYAAAAADNVDAVGRAVAGGTQQVAAACSALNPGCLHVQGFGLRPKP